MKKKFGTALVPNYSILIEATYTALKQLGGSGRNDEINKKVYSILSVPDEILSVLHVGRTSFSEIDYRLAWARTLLKNYGAIVNSARTVWVLSSAFANVDTVDGTVVEKYRNIGNTSNSFGEEEPITVESTIAEAEKTSWRQKIYDIISKMDPYAFERLSQRLLRECGFTDVVVTKKSGDGGIDGFGKLKVNGIISFNIAFQCKRYQSPVPVSEIRDFRGSLTKNIEKGVFITTGSFSPSAKEDAENPGKQQIDLVDGEALIDMLAEYGIGLTEVKDYEIDENYFKSI